MRYLLLLFLLPVTALAQQPVSVLQSRLKSGPDSTRIKNLLAMSEYYEVSQPDSAVHYANQAMQIAEKRNDRRSQAFILLQLGQVNAKHHHDDLARRFYNEGLLIFRNLHDQPGIALAYDELGLLDGDQKNTSAAATDLGRAMKYYQDTKNNAGVVETYSDLGKVYEQKGATDKALTYYLKALVQYEHRKVRSPQYFTLLQHISDLYQKKGDSKNAVRYLEEGLKNSTASADQDTHMMLLDTEGKVYEDENQKAKALVFYKQALAEARRYNRPEEQAKALINIAGVLKKQNAATSLQDLKNALKIASALHNKQLEASIYAALAAVYRQEKDYNEAINALEENHRLVDSLLETDTTKDIAALDSSYALETSRDEVGQLQKVTKVERAELLWTIAALAILAALIVAMWLYSRKVRKLNRDLKASNQVKDTLFSIIGHDLKGPAGSAAQLFAMMETEDFSQEELKGMISELRKQTEASFDLLNTLFEWGRTQLQGVNVSPEYFNAHDIVEKNINLLARQAAVKNIALSNNTRPDVQVYADPNHFDFIIRNLLSNAIKFTFEAGQIDVNSTESDKEIVYAVKDTGKGISEAEQTVFLQRNLQVSFGTKGEKGSGLGLALIKQFIRANKGRLWLESKEGKGSTFYFAFPKDLSQRVIA